MGKITAPTPLAGTHQVDGFDCGVPVLDEWLKRQAFANETSGASRTFVVCTDQRVVGYYALAAGSVNRDEAPGKISRMPEPIPVMVLGRLAVDLEWQQKGIGPGLLRDAVLRTLMVSRQAGIRAMVVHALSGEAKGFYQRYGFRESPLNQLTLMLGLADWKVRFRAVLPGKMPTGNEQHRAGFLGKTSPPDLMVLQPDSEIQPSGISVRLK